MDGHLRADFVEEKRVTLSILHLLHIIVFKAFETEFTFDCVIPFAFANICVLLFLVFTFLFVD